ADDDLNVSIGQGKAQLASERVLQIGSRSFCTLHLTVDREVPFIHAALVGHESIRDGFQRNLIPAQRDIVLVTGHAEIQVQRALYGSAINAELERADADLPAIELQGSDPVGDFQFAQVEPANVHLNGKV